MKRLSALTLTLLTLTGAVCAQTTSTPVGQASGPTAAMGESMAVEVEVAAVNLKERTVALKDADGAITTITVGPEVKNLPQVKVGDFVRVQYSQSLTVNLKKGAGLRDKSEVTDKTVAQPGQKPGAAAMRKVHITADIIDINPKSGQVKLKGPEGRILELTLNDPSVLKGYQVGDQVEGTFLQVMSIGVITPRARQ